MTNLRPMPPEDVQACIDKVARIEAGVEELKCLRRCAGNKPKLLAGLKEIERIMREVDGLLQGREWVN